MARLPNLNGVSETLPAIPKLPSFQKTQKRTLILGFYSNKSQEFQDQQLKIARRLALGLASIAIFENTVTGNVSLAEDNGLWLTAPTPIPPIYNKIANEETGTRSFLKKGIFMPNIGTKGGEHRLRKYAFDLLALGDLIDKDACNYVRKYLRLKCTVTYYDFGKLISAAPTDNKQPLTDLTNKLFNNVEKLEGTVKKHDLPKTESIYQDTTGIHQEVMNRMA
ncbi:photosynthetic NDH subunit of lumenal location 3, chloroplastic-like [Actinidia eriantha]|uniref:photosynthetic NDH subunit of lumenal location 3, chloroplastic-like n=1 Tax=Actinidia eriantha TaxID=165200 RepID=UPI00258F2A12|nr:photosynthetic NDH subunit of lumenal location 3, chloroplastic-like [Actinidia eriantha]